MNKANLVLISALVGLVGTTGADVVVERWGSSGPVQHKDALKYESAEGGRLMVFDLSALPKNATVYGARLFFFGSTWNDVAFDIVPAHQGKPAGEPLQLVAPRRLWFDATAAAQAWAKAGAASGTLLLRKAPKFKPETPCLEIAYEGKLQNPPPQVWGVKACCRAGQVFVTFKEIEPPDGGKETVAWTDLAGKFKGDYYGPVPGEKGPQLSYRVYRHDQPITPANIGQAQLLDEVLPGSGFNTRIAVKTDAKTGRQSSVDIEAGKGGEGLATGPGVEVLRLAVEPGKPVEPGTGIFVRNVAGQGNFYYAVLTASDGVTNTTGISEANVAGPVEEKPGQIEPVLYREFSTQVGGTKFVEAWYSYWTEQPLSPWPGRYDVAVSCCPDAMAKPAALYVVRTGWNSWPTPPGPGKTTGITLTSTGDQPVDFRTGLNDAMRTLQGFEGGKFHPFFIRRQNALVRWARANWPIDANAVAANVAAWGLQEIRHGDVYSFIHGWGTPELTKGWQSWNRACGIWGYPRMYEGRPDDENPYVVSDVTDWVLAHPEKELPFFYIHAAAGPHYTEMGWPPFPRFCWAMMKTKRAFLFGNRANPLGDAIFKGKIDLALNRSVPAFANCTLDDNVGEGELSSGDGWHNCQINGYVLWDSSSIAEEPNRWAITVWIDPSSYYPACTVDLTPRRCQKFKGEPARKFAWTNTLLPEAPGEKAPAPATAPATAKAEPGKLVQSGPATADATGLVTVEKLALTKGKHRIEIRPQ